MAPTITSVKDIMAGKIEWRLIVRVIRLWRVPDFKNPEQDNSIEMLLLDEKVSMVNFLIHVDCALKSIY